MPQQDKFNIDDNLTTMKQAVVNRDFMLQAKLVGVVAAAVTLGALSAPLMTMIFFPTYALSSAAAVGAMAGLVLGVFAGPILTFKENKTLDVDKQILTGGIHGNTLWDHYRHQVIVPEHNLKSTPPIPRNRAELQR